MKRLLCVVGFMTVSSYVYGAIAVDVSSASGVQGGSSPLTWTITMGGSANFIVVGCGTEDSASDIPTSITVGSLTLAKSTSTSGTASGATNTCSIFQSTGPSTGAQTVTVNHPGGNGNLQCGAVSFSGVTQTNAVDLSSTAIHEAGTPTSSTASLTTNVDNDMLIDTVLTEFDNSMVVGGGQTQQWNTRNPTQGAGTASSTKLTTTAGLYQMGWSDAGATNDWLHCVIAIKPSAAAATTINPQVIDGGIILGPGVP
jgi:hypothetical protein